MVVIMTPLKVVSCYCTSQQFSFYKHQRCCGSLSRFEFIAACILLFSRGYECETIVLVHTVLVLSDHSLYSFQVLKTPFY